MMIKRKGSDAKSDIGVPSLFPVAVASKFRGPLTESVLVERDAALIVWATASGKRFTPVIPASSKDFLYYFVLIFLSLVVFRYSAFKVFDCL